MSPAGALLIVSCFLSGLILCALGIYSRRFRSGPVALPYEILMYAAAFWAFDYAADLALADLPLKILAMEVRFIALPFIPLLEIWLVLAYLGREAWIRRWWVVPLTGIGIVTAVLALTSTYHNLFRYNYQVTDYAGIPVLVFTNGIWFGIYTAFVYGTLLAVLLILLLDRHPDQPPRTLQRFLLILVLVFPALPSLLNDLGLSPVPGVNFSPVLFWMLGILYIWILFPSGFFGIIPVARERIVESMHNPVIVLDPENRIADLNAAAAALAKTTPGHAFGKRIGDVFSGVPDLIRQCRSATAVTCDLFVHGPEDRIYLMKTDVLQGSSGRTGATILTLQDITERRRMEEELRDSEEKFRQFFNNVNDAVYVHRILPDGRPGRIIEANDVMCLRLGYTRDELLAMEMPDLVAEGGRGKMRDIAGKIRRYGHATFDTLHRAKDGTIIPVEVNTHLFIQKGEQLALASARDITERRLAEAALRSREQRFRNLFENMQEGLAYCRMIYDDDGRPADFIYLATNQAFDRIIGTGAVTGKRATEVFPGIREAFPQLFAIYGRVARTGVPESFDLDFAPAGRCLHISVYSPAKDHFTAIFTDITGQRQAADALQKSEEKFRNIFNSISDAVHVHGVDANGVPQRILAVNDAACAMAGYSREELLAMSPSALITGPGNRPPGDIGRDLATRGHAVFETEHIRKDKTVLPVEIHAHASMLAGENVLVSVIRDITERKKAGEALRASEHRRAMLLEAIPDIMFIIARDGTYRDFRVPAGAELVIPPDRIIGSNVRDTGLEEAVTATILDGIARALETGTMQAFEYALDLPGGRRQYEARIVAVGTDEVLGIVRDITQRKTAEELLRRSEEREREDRLRLANAMDLAHMANWEFDARTGTFTFNRRFYALYGTTPEREGGMQMPAEVYAREFSHPDDAGRVAGIIAEALTNPAPPAYTQIEHRIIRRDGEIRHIIVRLSTIRNEAGKTVGAYGINQDVTEQKRMEEALRESEEKYRTLVEKANEAILIAQDGVFVYANASMSRLLGVSQEDLTGRPFAAFIAPEDRDLVVTRYRQRISGGEVPESYDFRLIGSGGKIRWVSISAARLIWQGKPATLNLLTDITERKQAEAALQESRQLFSDIIAFLPDPTFVIDAGGRILAWNRAMELLSGVPAAAMVGKGDHEYSLWQYGERRPVLIDLVQHPDEEAARLNYLNTRREGHVLMAETSLTLPGRGELDLSLVASPLLDSAGTIIGAIESARDITAIRRTERALADLNRTLEQRVQERTADLESARAYNRSLFEAAIDPLILIGPDKRILDLNSAAEAMMGAGRGIIIGALYHTYVQDKEKAEAEFAEIVRTGRVTGSRYTILDHAGAGIPVIAGAVLLRDASGTPAGILVGLHDITRILKDEEKITAQLRENEILLREVHHRVKNNLQIIASLISLQARTLADPATARILHETRNRVHAIAIVHEGLHLTGELGTIDLGTYLRNLAGSLYASYHKNTTDIRLVIAVEDVILDIDTAAPLALIFNELIANTLRYAFPDGRKGECRITAHREDNVLTLVHEDNGVGMPGDFDWQKSPTLGMRLISILIGQLKGTIVLDRTAGTKFVITIPLPGTATGIHRVGGL